MCRASGAGVLADAMRLPVFVGVQYASAQEAMDCPRGDIRLVMCGDCGLVWNDRFDPGRLRYTESYDNALDYSRVYQDYARGLVERLIDTYDVRGKVVVELGCGNGEFLSQVCAKGGNRGIGFDPSARVEAGREGDVTYIRDVYSEKYSAYGGDLICCRHVLEHVDEPVKFLRAVRQSFGEGGSGVVYFEVPNARFVLERSVWDVIYEHCSYFSRESLSQAFRLSGFEVLRVDESYGGQFLSLEARPAGPGVNGSVNEMPASGLRRMAGELGGRLRGRVAEWGETLGEWMRSGQRAVVWGGGAKAVTFLNLLGEHDVFRFVVDINPNKQGKYMPGTAQEIVAPAFLESYGPDIVVLMNPIYEDEVRGTLRGHGIDAKLVLV